MNACTECLIFSTKERKTALYTKIVIPAVRQQHWALGCSIGQQSLALGISMGRIRSSQLLLANTIPLHLVHVSVDIAHYSHCPYYGFIAVFVVRVGVIWSDTTCSYCCNCLRSKPKCLLSATHLPCMCAMPSICCVVAALRAVAGVLRHMRLSLTTGSLHYCLSSKSIKIVA